MIQLNLDDIEAVLERANDDVDRVSVYEYREALNAVYRTAMRILSEKMVAEREIERLRERIATQEDGLRHGEQVCARLVAERDDAIAKANALHSRLAHTEADIDQALHNEAFNERQRIAAWIRARVAHASLDSRTSMQALDALTKVATQIERGEHNELV